MTRTTTTATAMVSIMNLYSAHDPKHPRFSNFDPKFQNKKSIS